MMDRKLIGYVGGSLCASLVSSLGALTSMAMQPNVSKALWIISISSAVIGALGAMFTALMAYNDTGPVEPIKLPGPTPTIDLSKGTTVTANKSGRASVALMLAVAMACGGLLMTGGCVTFSQGAKQSLNAGLTNPGTLAAGGAALVGGYLVNKYVTTGLEDKLMLQLGYLPETSWPYPANATVQRDDYLMLLTPPTNGATRIELSNVKRMHSITAVWSEDLVSPVYTNATPAINIVVPPANVNVTPTPIVPATGGPGALP